MLHRKQRSDMTIDNQLIQHRLCYYRNIVFEAMHIALTKKAQGIVDRAMEGDLTENLVALSTAFVLLENACDEAAEEMLELDESPTRARVIGTLRLALEQAKRVYDDV